MLGAGAGTLSTIAEPTALLSRYIAAVEQVWEYVDTWRTTRMTHADRERRSARAGWLLRLRPVAAASCPAAAVAQPAPPALTAPVNDFADVIDAASRAELERRIRALKEATGDVVVVATVPTFQPYGNIDEYAVKMFENGGRGIGEKGKDNGAAHRRRRWTTGRCDIEVGYDLEEFIPDGFAGQTIREAIDARVPRAATTAPGCSTATTRIINRIAEQRGVTLPDVPRERARPRRAVVADVSRSG